MTQSNLFQEDTKDTTHSEELYIEVAINRPLFQTFTYISHTTVEVGYRVQVQLANSLEIGLVVKVHTQKPETQFRIASIKKVIDSAQTLPPSIIQLLTWAASYYFQPIGEMLFTFIPNFLKQAKPINSLHVKAYRKKEGDPALNLPSNAKKQVKALEILQVNQPTTLNSLKEHGISSSIIKQLLSKELISEELTPPSINSFTHTHLDLQQSDSAHPIKPNNEQSVAINAVNNSIDKFNCFLLEGITGSGKTEVYIQICKHYLQLKQQVLILVPEIGLTPQLSHHLIKRLNAPVITLHSNIANKERAKRWLMTQTKEPIVVLGTRSAVACALPTLGCIILDEEQDTSFKQQEGVRYHSRSIALKRAQQEGIPVLLGSATPSLESINNQITQRFTPLSLKQRAMGADLPDIILEDTNHLAPHQIFTEQTLNTIQKTLSEDKQVLIFINRRGYAPTMQCTQCHWVAECQQCDTSLTIHKNTNTLECHHCETVSAIPKHCPNCHSPYLNALGFGTERIEDELQIIFKETDILRMDRDSTQNKGSLEEIRNRLLTGKPCILIGTQMVSKGHDFPDLTLTIILNTDNGLYNQDFRAKELLIQNLIQVSGRSGRGKHKGRVIIQTNYPEHPVLQFAIKQDYQAFAQNELTHRKALNLPPYHHTATIRMQSLLDNQAYQKLATLEHQLKAMHSQQQDISISTTMPAYIEKKSNWYRYLIMLSSPNRKALHSTLSSAQHLLSQQPRTRKLKWVIDVDPLDMA